MRHPRDVLLTPPDLWPANYRTIILQAKANCWRLTKDAVCFYCKQYNRARSASVRLVIWSKVSSLFVFFPFTGTCKADFYLFAFWLFLSAAERMTQVVIGAVLSLSFWVSLYCILCCVNGSRSYEWNCRLVTLLHGILAVCITAYIGYVDGPWPFSYPGEDQSLTWVKTASRLEVTPTFTISDPTTHRSV